MRTTTLIAGLAVLLSGCATVPTFAPRWEVDVRVAISVLGARTTAFVTAYVDVPESARPVTLTMHHDEVLVDTWTCAERVCQVSTSWARTSPSVLVVGVEDRQGKTAYTTVELHRSGAPRPVPRRRPP